MAKEQSSNPDIAEEAVFGSTESFFSALDKDVNGMVSEDSPVENKEVTPQVEPQKSADESGSVNTDWKKRYSDSTREAQRIKAELNQLKPYVPVLDAMKKDSGLVEHVREYINSGGKDVKDNLNLDEDFSFDTEELIDNPDSQSRKVFDAMVDRRVKEGTAQMIEQEKAVGAREHQKAAIKEQAEDFRVRNNLSNEQMHSFLTDAESRFKNGVLSFDDMYSILHRDNLNQNVANATKEDMLNQMRNVRSIPTSQGDTNSAGEKSSPNDDLFDTLKGVDDNLDNMFG